MGSFSIWHWIVVLVVLALAFLPIVFYSASMQKALEAVDVPYREQTPASSWLLLIPLFNAIWIFFLVSALQKGYTRMSEAGRLTQPSDGSHSIGIALAICWVLSLIPYVNLLAIIPALVLFILHWVKIVELRSLMKATDLRTVQPPVANFAR